MVKTQEWSETRSRVALSRQYKLDTGKKDKCGMREQSKDNKAVECKNIAMVG